LIVHIKKMLATNVKLKSDYEMLLNYVKINLKKDAADKRKTRFNSFAHVLLEAQIVRYENSEHY
jgi:hypothetical protein